MRRISLGLGGGLLCLALAGCSRQAPQPAPRAASSAPPRDQLLRVVERYWDQRGPADAAIAPQVLADSLALERQFLSELNAIAREPLDDESRLTYDLFKAQRESTIEGFTYPGELLPINPFSGAPLELAATAALASQRPLDTAAECEDWLRQIDVYVRWTGQAIVNLRDGMRRGYTVPRAVVQRMLPILQRLGAEDRTGVLYLPLRSMPAHLRDGAGAELFKRLNDATTLRLLPANRALHDFLQRDYLPQARSGLGLSALPLGRAWYAYRVRRATGGALTANEIHRLGLAEVDRLKARIAGSGANPTAAGDAVPASSAVDATSPQDLALPDGGSFGPYEVARARVTVALPALFDMAPTDDLVFVATDFLQDPASPLVYRSGRPARHRPAVIFVDPAAAGGLTRAAAIAGFLQLGAPGRHYQDVIAQQRLDLPRFRRYGDEPAFIAGWALYAASLGEELGVYGEDAAKLAAWQAQMRCAVALVVDTGLHALDWTRAQALDYLQGQAGIEEVEAQRLIDGYAAMPGDALACKIGEMRIHALRARAEQHLGTRFDLRRFHAAILQDGAMPMDLLESRINRWMENVP